MLSQKVKRNKKIELIIYPVYFAIEKQTKAATQSSSFDTCAQAIVFCTRLLFHKIFLFCMGEPWFLYGFFIFGCKKHARGVSAD